MAKLGKRSKAGSAGALVLVVGLACSVSAQQPEQVLVSDVIVRGNRLIPAEQVRNTMKTRPGREFKPAQLQEDVRALYATHLFRNVYADKQDDGPGRVKVLVIVCDDLNAVEKVEYRGARHLSKEDLDALTGVRVGSPLNPVANKVACDKIVRRLQEQGRAFAACTLLAGGEPTDRQVIFTITEGPKVMVKGLSFVGNHFVSAALLRQQVHTSNGLLGLGILGTPFSMAALDTDVAELLKYYRGLGFHDVRVGREARYSSNGQDVQVTFHIHEGVRYRVQANPVLRGTRCVPPDAFRRMTTVKAGEYYDQRKVDRDLKALKDYLGYTGRDVRTVAVPVFAKGTPGVVGLVYEVAPARPVVPTARGVSGEPVSQGSPPGPPGR
jgi:outer membrane protein insertion porin family